jgi:YD repeat-containing protein
VPSITALGRHASKGNGLALGWSVRPVLSLLILLSSTACAVGAAPLHKGGIDPSTGVYTREDEDLIVADGMPLILRRTYLSADRVSRQFGIGGTHPGEWYLIGDGATFQWAELILSTGGRIHFDRISPGTSKYDAVFEHRATPTRFLGARLRREDRGWRMEFADGGNALFKHCNPNNSDVCSILEQHDKDGHGIQYERDAAGRLLEMRGDTQRIRFRYDEVGRIIRAEDSRGGSVDYSYDDRGRLSRVRGVDGVERRYGYTDRDQLSHIEEPRMWIDNRYDDDGRVTRQRLSYPDSDDTDTITFDYTVRDSKVVQTDTIEFDGTHTRTTYNAHHYRTSQVLDVDGARPVVIRFDRDESNTTRRYEVQCGDGSKKNVDARLLGWGEAESDGWSIAAWICRG